MSQARVSDDAAQPPPRRSVRKAALQIHALSLWVDQANAHRDREAALWGRIGKLTEEVGEVSEAMIGATGQNPRKGTSHAFDDVEYELNDAALTALVAIDFLRQDGQQVIDRFFEFVDMVYERAGIGLDGRPREAGDLEARYLADHELQQQIAHARAHPEEATPRPPRRTDDGEATAEDYRMNRSIVVACGQQGEDNCRHAWNAKYPDDPVTEAEQEAFAAGFEPESG